MVKFNTAIDLKSLTIEQIEKLGVKNLDLTNGSVMFYDMFGNYVIDRIGYTLISHSLVDFETFLKIHKS